MNENDLTLQIERILLLQEPEKKNKATEFLLFFQGKQIYPYAAGTKGLYRALTELYNYLGSRAQREKEYNEAMRWFTESLSIVSQSEECCRDLPDTFLYLGHLYLSVSKYSLALHYTKLLRRYNPAMTDFCDDMIRSIDNVQRILKQCGPVQGGA